MYFTGSGFRCLLNVVLSAALDLAIILKSYGEIRTEYGVSLHIPSEYGKMRTKKISVFGHFSRSEILF